MEFYLGRTLFPVHTHTHKYTDTQSERDDRESFQPAFLFFQTHDSEEHLSMMEKILGPIPLHLLEQTR